MKRLLLVLALATAAAACDKPQSGPTTRKVDSKAWDAAHNPYVAGGWKSGDAASWEAQMRERAARQNEYARVSHKQ